MTTTTFTAPLTLLWVQVRILRWVLAALMLTGAAQLLRIAFPHALFLISELYTVTVLLPIAFFIGPILFGSEYSEGSRDYIRTRPVSSRVVFSVKLLLLISLSTLCSFLSVRVGFSAVESLPSVALFLVIGLWTSTVTILTKDLVRGILLGSVSLVGAVLILYFLLTEVFLLIPHTDNATLKAESEAFFTIHLLSVSPLLLYAVLGFCHRWSLTGRFSLGITPMIALLLFLGNCLLPVGYYYREGRAVQKGEVSPCYLDVMRYERSGDQISILFSPHSHDGFKHGFDPAEYIISDDQEVHLNVLSCRRDGDQVILLGTIINSADSNLYLVTRRFDGEELRTVSIHLLPEVYETPPERVIQSRERAAVLHRDRTKITLYNVEDSERANIVKVFETDRGVYWLSHGSKGSLFVMHKNRPAIDAMNWRKYYRLALSDGDLVEATQEVRSDYFGVQSDLLFGRDSIYRLGMRSSGVFYITRTEGKEQREVATLPISIPKVIDRGLFAAFNASGDVQDHTFKADYSTLNFFDLNDPENPVILSGVEIPRRLALSTVSIDWARKIHGRIADNLSSGLSCFFGGRYLVIQSRQGALGLWDLADPRHPEFLGLAGSDAVFVPDHHPPQVEGLPSTYTPFTRSDGALGYLTTDGTLLWLEFPALMKEEEQS